MKKLLIALIFFALCCSSAIESRIIPITLEHAVTPEQHSWGLMGRESLPPSHGMLFHYATSKRMSVWSFNCHIDLSLAFLDSRGVILEIQDLKAYPEAMDPARPVLSPRDLSKYPLNDPITRFFIRNSVTSKKPATYLLEMNAGWFSENNVNVGDVLISQKESYIQTFKK